ncbi:DUF2806 domain-containing protein [Luteimonas composti]|uniref:DUF2806 domain-containing protein n=1 Tax=Luteimonas composti TaxID=398257 RepID=A0ABT6MSG3_9GAMM|nr:DUF2806 domain-containing protein [Luteimonas composti]MDH7453540.1 DUF2806 domain-containing protein [Luteimonas composti]
MKISDLAGLSKPITRLIEVISKGTGAVSAPSLTKANAKATAEKVHVLAAAIAQANEEHGLAIAYKDQELEIWRRPEDDDFRVGPSTLDARGEQRREYVARLRQNNVESITSAAAIELAPESEVPDTAPEQDWINRFFRAAEDISSEQMQLLWGRILAGEIKSPGSYSLRTLEFFRNLTRENATLLELLCRQAVWYAGAAFIPMQDPAWLKTHRLVYEGHHFEAAEFGALYPTALTYRLLTTAASIEVLSAGRWALKLERGQSTDLFLLPVWKFTNVGKELVQLIGHDGDREQLVRIGAWFAQQGASAAIGELVAADGRDYTIRGLTDVPANA